MAEQEMLESARQRIEPMPSSVAPIQANLLSFAYAEPFQTNIERALMKAKPPRAKTALQAALALSLAWSLNAGAAPLTWNAASDFSLSKSATSPWSYGTTGTALDGALNAFTQSASIAGYDYFSAASYAQIGKAGPSGFSSGSVSVPAGALNVSPGSAGEYAVLRFNAQATGSYAIDAAFWGDDFVGPTTTDVHVRSNGVDLFGGDIASYGEANALSWSGPIMLVAGQTIDFAVGFGSNRTYNYDNTGLDVRVSKLDASVPEPGTLAGLSLGFGLMGVSRRKLRRGPVSG